MGKFVDLTGMKFGRLTVIERVRDKEREKKQHTSFWKCSCECGGEVIASKNHLEDGHIRSCGCLHDESCKVSNRTHGQTKTRLHAVWTTMIQRCTNPNNPKYKRYGERGITICNEWRSFENFYKWAYENGYDENLSSSLCTIDRKNNNGNYEPSNCRWTTNVVQMNNTSTNVYIEFNGEKHTGTEWSRILGFSDTLINERLRKGWSVEKAFSKKPRKKKITICNGKIFQTLVECAKYYNASPQTMRWWLSNPEKMPDKWKEMGLKYLDDEVTS